MHGSQDRAPMPQTFLAIRYLSTAYAIRNVNYVQNAYANVQNDLGKCIFCLGTFATSLCIFHF
jgi:hypothetical protein